MAIVTVIGGANIDIQGVPFGELRFGDSNPGKITLSPGGVGRNVADNAARLGLRVRFLSAFGGDPFSEVIRESLARLGIDTTSSLVRSKTASSAYVSLIDNEGTLFAAVADMEIVDELDIAWLERTLPGLKDSDLFVVDTNLSRRSLEFTAKALAGTSSILDTVSMAKAVRAKDCFGLFTAVKPNVREAEVLTGVEIRGDSDLDRAADVFHASGNKLVFISLGKRGLYYSDRETQGIASMPAEDAVSVTGAGDAITAAIAFGMVNGLSAARSAMMGATAATLTARVTQTVNPAITLAVIESLLPSVRVREWT